MTNDSYQRAWRVTQRQMEFEGELRAAILRVAIVIVFYAIQLVHFLVFADRSIPAVIQFHRSATLLAAAALFVSIAVIVVLARRWFPNWLKFCVVAADLALITAAAHLGSGPMSPAVSLFYLAIAMCALRWHLGLVWFGTLGAMACYWTLVGLVDDSWFDRDHTVAPIEQAMKLVSLGAVGVILGQCVRMLRAASLGYSDKSQRFAKEESAK